MMSSDVYWRLVTLSANYGSAITSIINESCDREPLCRHLVRGAHRPRKRRLRSMPYETDVCHRDRLIAVAHPFLYLCVSPWWAAPFACGAFVLATAAFG